MTETKSPAEQMDVREALANEYEIMAELAQEKSESENSPTAAKYRIVAAALRSTAVSAGESGVSASGFTASHNSGERLPSSDAAEPEADAALPPSNPPGAGPDVIQGRRKRLSETVRRIGNALEAGRALASIFPLEEDALPKAKEIVAERLALLNTACYEFKTTFHHDLEAVSTAANPPGDVREKVIKECAKIAADVAGSAATPNGKSRAKLIEARIRALASPKDAAATEKDR